MKTLNHPNIIKLHENLENVECFYYVMELVKGVDLFKYVTDRDFLEELVASRITKEIAEALQYIHAVGIIHRDIKPENVMMQVDTVGKSASQKEIVDWKSEDSIQNIKIIDFGFSCYREELVSRRTACGTPDYVAPEIFLNQDYDYQVDVFALGVIIYFMVRGFLPFHSDIQEILITNITTGNYQLEEDEHFLKISPQCKDLIKKMLHTNPKERITISGVLQHPWITEMASLRAYFGKNREQFDVANFVDYNFSKS